MNFKKFNLLVFTLFVCFICTIFTFNEVKADSIPEYTFTKIAKPTGYYKRTNGTCYTYPTIGSTYGYCAEAGQEYNSTASYSSCSLGLTCMQIAEAYYGAVENTSAFYQAQGLINGRTFYTNSSCTTAIDTSDAYNYAYNYCYTWPSFGATTFNIKVGDTIVLTDANYSLDAFSMNYTSTSFTASKSGNNLTITGLSETSGDEILLYRGNTVSSSVSAYCSDTSQNYFTVNKLPYVYTLLTINITKETTVVTPTYGALKIVKTNTDGTALEGVKFKIGTNLNGTQNTDWEYAFTNANGIIEKTNIPVGTVYYYQEVQTLSGYILDTTTNYVTISSSTTYTRNLTNSREEYGGFKIVKTDQFGNYLAGVKFKVGTNSDLSGTEGTDWNYYTTDASGIIVIDGLSIGDIYYYQEVESLTSYEFDSVIRQIEITETGVIEQVGVTNNKISERKFKVIKRDVNSLNGISGVTFDLYNSSDTKIATLTTDSDGEAYYNDIVDGEYYLIETSAPSGYKYSSNPITFEISETNTNVMLEVTNEFQSPKTGIADTAAISIAVIGISGISYMYFRKKQKFI